MIDNSRVTTQPYFASAREGSSNGEKKKGSHHTQIKRGDYAMHEKE